MLLNTNLVANNQQFKFGYDSASQKYGYVLKEADTDVFVPFSQKRIKLGNRTNAFVAHTFDVKPFVSDYANLTINDFVLDTNGLAASEQGGANKSVPGVYATYNSSTGILTVNQWYEFAGGNWRTSYYYTPYYSPQ